MKGYPLAPTEDGYAPPNLVIFPMDNPDSRTEGIFTGSTDT